MWGVPGNLGNKQEFDHDEVQHLHYLLHLNNPTGISIYCLNLPNMQIINPTFENKQNVKRLLFINVLLALKKADYTIQRQESVNISSKK